MYAEEWLGHSLLRCGTSYELGFRKAEEKMSKELRDNYELGVITGAAQERERIIKLLNDSCCESSNCICDNCLEVAVTIALIKGEQK